MRWKEEVLLGWENNNNKKKKKKNSTLFDSTPCDGELAFTISAKYHSLLGEV